ncbi:MAG: hypothetical protein Q9M19_05690 [Mariprofundaceae bacterium]|nr:hypothetical protein [Mariprofundaceae bacterium]
MPDTDKKRSTCKPRSKDCVPLHKYGSSKLTSDVYVQYTNQREPSSYCEYEQSNTHWYWGKKVWHLVPNSWSTYESCNDEFKKSWALDNLQPMWWEDNLTENNKYIGGVPSLY